jgi:YYY domain-containing protein
MDVTQKPSSLSNGRRLLEALRHEAVPLALLAVVLAVALGLRLYGLNWDQGFGWTPHPDERFILSKVDEIRPPPIGELDTLLDAEESPWNPRRFAYGSLPFYLLKGVQLVYGLLPGEGLRDLRVTGRALSALADLGAVAMVFVLGSRIYGRRVGLLGAAFTALAVIHIQLSHFFAVDTLLALFTIVALYFMYRVAVEGRLQDSLLAGAFVGMGLATKVSQAPIYAALVVAHLLAGVQAMGFRVQGLAGNTPNPVPRTLYPALRGLVLGGAASLVVFFIAQPYAFLDWSRFFGDVVEQSEMVRRIRDYPYTRQYVDTTPYWYQVQQLATWGLGWPLGIVAWGGLLYVSLRGMRLRYGLAYLALGWGLPIAILLLSTGFLAILAASGIAVVALLATLPLRPQESRLDVLLLSWVVPYLLITGAFQVKFLRYLLPITPFLLLFGAKMLVALWDRLKSPSIPLYERGRGDASTKGGQRIPQAASSQEGQPVSQAASSQEGQPVSTAASSQEGQPVSQAASSQEGQPVSQAASPQEGQPVSQAASSQEGQPVSQAASSQEGQPVSQAASPQEGQPVSPAASSQEGQPVSQDASPQEGQPVSPFRKGGLRGIFLAPGVLRSILVFSLALLLVATAFYALSYVSIYQDTHTAVRASQWLNQSAPKGSVILKEHWEEGLPDLQGYEIRELPMYDDDTPQKLNLLADELARGDYLVFFSNRLYGTVPRLTERYPVSREYYRLLFTGELGYELARTEATYPHLLGVSFVDDTFSRPGLPEPEALSVLRPSSFVLDLGFADESFSVYDHPKVMIFKNVGRLDPDTMRRRIKDAVPPAEARPIIQIGQTAAADGLGLLLSPEDAAAQQRGGTWSEIIRPDSWTNRFPVVAWLLLLEGIALLALPIALVAFRPLADRGYLFSKALGILLVCLVVWLFASLRWMAFSREAIAIGLVAVGLASAVIFALRRREMLAFVRERWPVLLIGEAVFLAAFLAFVVVRMANPDLWHPFRGGEKPMDFAYLNAVLRSTYMPPYDPWFGGGYLNYYYWGQFITATLIRATGIDPVVAFNLAVPTFFALTVAGSFALVYNLAAGTRGWGMGDEGRGDNSSTSIHRPSFPVPHPLSPILAGLAGALFVAVIGNLDGAVQVFEGFWRAIVLHQPFGEFDYWRSTRLMPPDPPGFEINEFPFFTFLFADLHAHLMALPFTLLALGLSLAVVRPRGEVIRLALLGITIGSLRLINTWDFPTYLLIGVAAVFLGELFAQGGPGLLMLVRAGLKSLFIFVVGYLAFLPFHLTYETFFNSVERTTNTTVLWQFLVIHGLFIFIIGSFFVGELLDLLKAGWRSLSRRVAWVAQATSEPTSPPVPLSAGGEGGPRGKVDSKETTLEATLSTTSPSSGPALPLGPPSPPAESGTGGEVPPLSVGRVVALALGAVVVGFILTALFSSKAIGSTIPFVAILLALVLAVGLRWLRAMRPDAPYVTFAALMVAVALMLAIGLDVFRVEGDIDRMNSVFKFYLQIWVLLALASAYLLWRMAWGRRGGLTFGKSLWLSALAVLMLSAFVYTVMGAQDRLRDRFNGRVLPLTLDGAAYAQGTTYYDRQGEIDLAADFEGIQWLRENVQGSPIILEGLTPSYQWGGRISIYTGLPSVVGWQWHQEQQRWDYRDAIGRRIQEVNRIYSTTDAAEAMFLLRKYGVEYVYVGQLERLYYPGPGLDKFERELDKVFQGRQAAIYRVRDG